MKKADIIFNAISSIVIFGIERGLIKSALEDLADKPKATALIATVFLIHITLMYIGYFIAKQLNKTQKLIITGMFGYIGFLCAAFCLAIII
jgi:hypothetical protein